MSSRPEIRKLGTPPSVSICIPAYNAEETLGETLESILGQSYPCLEVLVSDNHSTDGTREVVNRFAHRGVRCLLNARPRPAWAAQMPVFIGAYINCNFVLSRAQGDFVCLYHADDIYDRHIVEREVAVMTSRPNVGAVFTMYRAIGSQGRPVRSGVRCLPPALRGRETLSFNELVDALLRYGSLLMTPSVMIRRTVLETVGEFNEQEFLTAADLEMWLRIARRYPIALIDEPLLNYRVSEKQFGAQYQSLRSTLADFFRVMDRFLEDGEVLRATARDAIALYEMERSADYVLCAVNLAAQGRSAEARARLRNALGIRDFLTARKRPRRLMRLIVGAGLLLLLQLRLGTLAGGALHRAYAWELKRRRHPMNTKREGSLPEVRVV